MNPSPFMRTDDIALFLFGACDRELFINEQMYCGYFAADPDFLDASGYWKLSTPEKDVFLFLEGA